MSLNINAFAHFAKCDYKETKTLVMQLPGVCVSCELCPNQWLDALMLAFQYICTNAGYTSVAD